MSTVDPQQAGASSNGQEAEALLAGVLAAAKAALPNKGLDLLVWGAARLGDQATLRHLLANGGGTSWTYPMDGEETGQRGTSCLWAATISGHGGTVKVLLESGVDDVDEAINTVNLPAGATPLIMAGVTPLIIAAFFGYEGVVEQLLKAGADVNKVETICGFSPLHMAALQGHKGVVEQLVKADGADVNKVDTLSGATPLHTAAVQGHKGVVEQLMKAGADVDKTNTIDGSTPLHLAARQGHKGVVELLVKAGVDADKAETSDGFTPLHLAAYNGHAGVVEQLVKAGVDVDKAKTSDGANPLHTAAVRGHEGVVELLLKAGADPNTETDDGITPLILAAEEDHSKICSILLKSGANVDHDVAPEHRTALKVAVTRGCRKAALVLMEHGASCDGAILTREQLEQLTHWIMEALKEKEKAMEEKEKAMEEKDAQMERLVQGIPEWCAQAASAQASPVGKQQQGGNSPADPAMRPPPGSSAGTKPEDESAAPMKGILKWIKHVSFSITW